jgi:D-alanyl-D-alanine carboxypeptidase/D-alanyl-D-alanine-endopeptidase (penicillin-binding protein 4)
VLDDLARRPPGCGQVEQRPDLGLDDRRGLAHGSGPTPIIRGGQRRHKGRAAHLRARLGPAALLAIVATLLVAVPAPAADGSLRTRLDRALRVPGVDPARTAALAVDLRTGGVVYSRNASLALLPASNEKVPVAYAALSLLGGSYRFHTDVVGAGSLAGSTWRGNLFLRGFGDPTLGASDLDELATEVAAAGVRRVTGAVVGDESWFDALRTGPGWKARFYLNESPPLSALVVSRSWYRDRSSHNPALAAASLFRQALAARGVLVAKPSRTGTLKQEGFPLAADYSVPLAKIVRYMGRESDNFTAELLVKQLGALERGHGSTAAGVAVVRRTLAAAGVPLAGVRLADGSGLSGLNRLTAAALVKLLETALADPKVRDAFVGSLAVAGVDGTLERRMRTRPARGRVIAKTGSLRAASALAGFVRGRYAFAVLQNGRPVSSYWARRAQDRFATVLAAA